MKKTLAIILAILMIATTVPFAFAAETCEHPFNSETFDREDRGYVCAECGETVFCPWADYTFILYEEELYRQITEVNYYADTERAEELKSSLKEAVDEIYGKYPYVKEQKNIASEQELVDAAAEEMHDLMATANADIQSGEYGLVLNWYALYNAIFDFYRYEFGKGVDIIDWDVFIEEFFTKEVLDEMDAVVFGCMANMEEIQSSVMNGYIEITEDVVAEFNETSLEVEKIYQNMAVCLLKEAHTYTAYSTVIDRPVYDAETDTWSKGTCLLACEYCGRKSTETAPVDRADYTGFEESMAEFEEILATEGLLTATKNGYTITLNAIRDNFYQYYIETEQLWVDNQVDIINRYIEDIRKGIEDGNLIKADYSPIKVLLDELMALIDNDPSKIMGPYYGLYAAPNGYYNGVTNSSYEHSGASQKHYIDDFTADLEELIALIKNGTALKIDGAEEYFERQDALNEELTEKYGEEAMTELADKIGDKYDAKFDELMEKAAALTGSVADNEEALAEIDAELEAIFAEIERCLDGTHTITYAIKDEATCQANATQDGICELCGEYKETEVADTKLEHKDDDGDYACDYGCGYEFEMPADDKCEDCGMSHDSEIGEYICMLVNIIRFIISVFNLFK